MNCEDKSLRCDEPTGNLDPENKEQIIDIIFSFVKEQGNVQLPCFSSSSYSLLISS